MRRIVVLGAAALAVVVLMAAGYAVAAGAGGHDAPAHAAVRSTRALTGLVPQAASATLPAEPMATSGPGKPNITLDLIRYGPRRRHEMAAYARRHYHVDSSRLHPKLIVLHFTASGAGSYPGVHALFNSNTPNGGELPGVCAHYVVDQDGTIYQQVRLRRMCRHAIGVNDRAIGIEMIQSTGRSSHWADQQILHRRPQIRSVLRLVRWLQARFDISKRNVIGHAMVNDSPFFHDFEGWRNDHTDWLREDVRELRHRL